MKTGMVGALSFVLVAGLGLPAQAAEPHGISEVRYDVTFDAETAARREIHIEMSFYVDGAEEMIELSLPSWTPGSYQLDDYAKNVRNAWATQDGSPIRWDKGDFDTWRVYPNGAGRVTLGFDYFADALDVGSAWASGDLAAFNGTNVFPFPEDQDLAFDAEVVFHTEDTWKIATGLTAGREARSYTAAHYDELVDMPTFVGRFDVDSTQIGGKWYRLASYPEGVLVGENRSLLWNQIQQMMPPMDAVFGETPWETYTTLLLFQPGLGGGSALEHSNSHWGIYDNLFLGSPILASITAHEIFHAWNVKRLRPADLWPYDYGRQMPTELLWVSEGITDYYADLALVRGQVIPNGLFYQFTQGKIDNVNQTVPVALEDASLSTWIQPRDGTSSIYYDKGSLVGLMLDILIRDETDNARSLDDVMRKMYEDAYQQGRGFTEREWWAAVGEVSDGRSFEDFHDAFVDGRDPFPWEEILPLAGLDLHSTDQRLARIGITTTGSDAGVEVVDVTGGGAASRAGVESGDILLFVGDIDVQAEGANFGAVFRDHYGNMAEGTPYRLVVSRNGQEVTLQAELAFANVTSTTLREDQGASEKARRIREGLLTGRTN